MSEVLKLNNEEIELQSKKIMKWYRRNEKVLTILTCPFNTSLIFIDIIKEALISKKKILYIWNNKNQNTLIINKIREDINFVHINHHENKEADLTFLNYETAINIQSKYDLIIMDDISNKCCMDFTKYKNLKDKIYNNGSKIIYYITEILDKYGEVQKFNPIYTGKPFVEPRVITTRINLNEDIPYILYDYLKWFRSEKMTVVMYVPDEEKLETVYNYYKIKLKMENVVVTILSEDNKKFNKNVLKIKDKAIFIITNNMEVSLGNFNAEAVVVLFCDDSNYKYKDLLYVCGDIGRINKKIPEVILVAGSVSDLIERVKDKTREYNMLLWEKRCTVV